MMRPRPKFQALLLALGALGLLLPASGSAHGTGGTATSGQLDPQASATSPFERQVNWGGSPRPTARERQAPPTEFSDLQTELQGLKTQLKEFKEQKTVDPRSPVAGQALRKRIEAYQAIEARLKELQGKIGSLRKDEEEGSDRNQQIAGLQKELESSTEDLKAEKKGIETQAQQMAMMGAMMGMQMQAMMAMMQMGGGGKERKENGGDKGQGTTGGDSPGGTGGDAHIGGVNTPGYVPFLPQSMVSTSGSGDGGSGAMTIPGVSLPGGSSLGSVRVPKGTIPVNTIGFLTGPGDLSVTSLRGMH